jgi:hypothetical protein
LPSLKRHTAEILIVLVLFFVYAGCALTLGVLGVSSYSRTVGVLQEGFNERSGILYISQKIQQSDVGGGIRIDQYQDNNALVFIEQETGLGYETWLFLQDGYLCEQLVQPQGSIIPGMAQRIMPMKALRLELSGNNLLSVLVTTDMGTTSELCLPLRSNSEPFNASASPSPRVQGTDNLYLEEIQSDAGGDR